MLTVGLFPNSKKANVGTVAGWMIRYLSERGAQVLLPAETSVELGFPGMGRPRDILLSSVDLALTVGGDGTLLHTVRETAPAGIPVCGVNMGQLGFLTEIELTELGPSLDRLVNGDYTVEERLMLDARVVRAGRILFASHALNDVVVTKGGFSRMIRLRLHVDGELAARYPADGLIVSTSTGSTGYSLSAGGPIVNPRLRVILLTPICPHTLHARSLVISDREEVMIGIQATHNDIVLTVDGQTVFTLEPDDAVFVRSAAINARFIRFGMRSYYETLRTKLRRGDVDEDPDCGGNGPKGFA